MASIVRLPEKGSVDLLDPGAGAGSLTAAIIERILDERPGLDVRVTAFEIDDSLSDALAETLAECAESASRRGGSVTTEVRRGDFIEWASQLQGNLFGAFEDRVFDLVIMNPPYRKIPTRSRERAAVERIGVEVTNLYSAFLALGVASLRRNGQLVAITPRSFANGPYFRSFRQFFFDEMGLERLHVFDSRTTVFGSDNVIQENVVFAGTRGTRPQRAVISRCAGDLDEISETEVAYREIVRPGDPERFLRIPAGITDALVSDRMELLPATLTDLDIQVSTGRVVDFRACEHLKAEPEAGAAPLIYPQHLVGCGVQWPAGRPVRANALVRNDATAKLFLPNEPYVLVKRLTSKEERRRVVAVVYTGNLPGPDIAFENHLNVFHRRNRGLSLPHARGLAAFLNSSLIDGFVRQFNGHTQINATDLRNLRYPSVEQLAALGRTLAGMQPGQDELDDLVECYVGVVT